MKLFRTTGVAAGLIAAGTLIGASLSTFASVFDWSTTPATNATADPNINWAEGMLPSAVNDSARATMAAIAAYVKDQGGLPVLASSGSGTAFSITLSQPMTAWTPGVFGFFARRTNTGTVTITVNSPTGTLTPKPLRAVSGTELVAGQVLIGGLYFASYQPATDEVLLVGKLAINATDFAPVGAGTVKANITGGAAQPSDVSLASFFGAAPAASISSAAINVQGYSTEVRWFNASACPTGWITADGTGGSPDLRGEFIRGLDNGRGIDPARVLASHQADSIVSHTHSITDPGHSHTFKEQPFASGPAAIVETPVATGPDTFTTNSATTGITINATGGNETRPRNVALLACYHA